MKKLIALVIFLMVAGCLIHRPPPFHYVNGQAYQGSGRSIVVHVDKEFSPMDRLSIDDAIHQWNYALNGYIKIEIVDFDFDMQIDVIRNCKYGSCWLIMKVNSQSDLVKSYDDLQPRGSYVLGWAEVGGTKMYLVRNRLYNWYVTGVSLHEMGHLLGARHDGAYLMNAEFNWEDSRCVDYASLAAVAEFQKLDIRNLNYCIYEK